MAKTYKSKYRVHDIVYIIDNGIVLKDEIVSIHITEIANEGPYTVSYGLFNYSCEHNYELVGSFLLYDTREEAEAELNKIRRIKNN